MPVTFPIMLDGSTAAATPTENNVVTRSGKNTKINALEYDNSMITLREAVNDLHDKKATQADLDAVQADALLKLQAMTEAEVFARAAINRDRYAGNGWIDWGNYNTTCSLIQNGLWAYTGTANTIFLGRDKTNVGGESKSNFPYVNVNGNILYLKHINEAGGYNNAILLPPAPATADILEREDLVFLESWHEKIADKDIAYPYGNVQCLATIDPSTGLATVDGSFPGYGTYSLFGNWQASGDLIGKGLVWSTMSVSDKQKFISDPRNNVYLSADGTWMQVRYRIRVIQGLGPDWFNVSNTNNHLMYGSFTDYVHPKGAKTSITDDLGATGGGAGLFVKRTQDGLFLKPDIGAWVATSDFIHASDSFGYKGLCFSLPICLVPRLNQGAYHWPLNTNGAANVRKSTGGAYDFYYSDLTISTTEEAFDLPYRAATGDIASGLSGRPDGKFYDAIDAGDIKDLRTSAHKVTDLGRFREREFNRLEACEIRGWEKQFGISAIYDFHGEYVNTSDGYLSASMRAVAEIGDYVFNRTDGLWFYVYNAGATNIRPLIGRPPSTVYSSTATGGTRDWLLFKPKFSAASKTLLQCDIIGSPANYYRGHYDFISSNTNTSETLNTGDVVLIVTGTTSGTVGHFYKRLGSNLAAGQNLFTISSYGDSAYWEDLGTDREDSWFKNKLPGTPLLVGEKGEDYIPDGTSKTFKMSHKVKSLKKVLLSTDYGETWSDDTAWWDSIEGPSNSRVISPPSPRVFLVFYETEADPFEIANNAKVLSIGNVWAGNHNLANYGNCMLSNLIGKVATNALSPTNKQGFPAYGYRLSVNGLLTPAADYYPQHRAITLAASSSPAVKVLYYLTSENGKLYLQLLFCEMIYDVSSGWGDDGKFPVIDGVGTSADDNGNLRLVGQKRIELQNFYSEAA